VTAVAGTLREHGKFDNFISSFRVLEGG